MKKNRLSRDVNIFINKNYDFRCLETKNEKNKW